MSGPAPIQTTTQQPGGSSNQNTDPKSAASPGVGSQAPAANAGTAGQTKSETAERFAALARQEKSKLDLKRRAEEELNKNKGLSEKLSAYETRRAEAQKDPFKFIQEELGLSYEQLTEMQLNGGKPTTEMEITQKLSKIDKWEEEQKLAQQKRDEEAKTYQEQQQQAEYEKQVKDFKSAIPDQLAKIEKLDMVTALLEPEEQSEEIFKIIEAHWATEEEKFEKDNSYQQKMMSVEEAAEVLEEILQEKFVKYGSKSKKFGDAIKNALSPAAPKATEKPSGFTASKASTTTLTNEATSSGATSLVSAATDNDRMKRAMAALGS
jgi:hypothetical protein